LGHWYYYVAELLEYGDGSHAIWLHYWSYAAHGSRFWWEYGEAGPCDRPETMSPNEARTRKEKIDPALLKAGWNLRDLTQVGIEIPVDGYDAEPWNGITDYCLYRPNGEVLAVVEAKKQVRDPNVAREQARHYITEIAQNQSFQPFAFLTNSVNGQS
jgi:hypothetical protein